MCIFILFLSKSPPFHKKIIFLTISNVTPRLIDKIISGSSLEWLGARGATIILAIDRVIVEKKKKIVNEATDKKIHNKHKMALIQKKTKKRDNTPTDSAASAPSAPHNKLILLKQYTVKVHNK